MNRPGTLFESVIHRDFRAFYGLLPRESQANIFACVEIHTLLVRDYFRIDPNCYDYQDACKETIEELYKFPIHMIVRIHKTRVHIISLMSRFNITIENGEWMLYDCLSVGDEFSAIRIIANFRHITREEAKSLLTIRRKPKNKEELRRYCRWLLYPDQDY